MEDNAFVGNTFVFDYAFVKVSIATTIQLTSPLYYLLIRNLKNLLDTAMLLQMQLDFTIIACRHEF